jgi:hypothetical protein
MIPVVCSVGGSAFTLVTRPGNIHFVMMLFHKIDGLGNVLNILQTNHLT